MLTVTTKHVQNLILYVCKSKTLKHISTSVSGQRTVILEQLPWGQHFHTPCRIQQGVLREVFLHSYVSFPHQFSVNWGKSLYGMWTSLRMELEEPVFIPERLKFLFFNYETHKQSIGLLIYINEKMYNPKLAPDSSLSANSPQLHKTKSGPTITKKTRLIKSPCKNYENINPFRLK